MRTDYIESELYNKMYVLMQYENALALRVSLETGMRIDDVLSLRPSDIEGRKVRYTAKKTGKVGRATLSADLAKRLDRIKGKHFVFVHRIDPKKHRTRQAVWKDVKKAALALHAAGYLDDRNVAPHSARKSFAVDDRQKFGLPHTQKALQHSDKSTTMIYAFADELIGLPPDFCLDPASSRRLLALEKKIDMILDIVKKL